MCVVAAWMVTPHQPGGCVLEDRRVRDRVKEEEHAVSFKASRTFPQSEWTLDPEYRGPGDSPGEHPGLRDSTDPPPHRASPGPP